MNPLVLIAVGGLRAVGCIPLDPRLSTGLVAIMAASILFPVSCSCRPLRGAAVGWFEPRLSAGLMHSYLTASPLRGRGSNYAGKRGGRQLERRRPNT
jgi:hypothetical protein